MARACPDCGKKMGRIQVLDRTDGFPKRGLQYTAVNAEKSFWRGFPVIGTIEALLCKKCRRVIFYAVKSEKPKRPKKSWET